MIRFATNRRLRTLTDIPFDKVDGGHLVLPEMGSVPNGFSSRTFDVNLDRPKRIASRTGMRYMVENPAAQSIATFEPSEPWTLTDDVTPAPADTTNFREWEVGGQGTQGRAITAVGGTSTTIQVRSLGLNLGSDNEEVFGFWLYHPLITVAKGDLRITFQTANGAPKDEFSYTITAGIGDFTNAPFWRLHLIPKKDFTLLGGVPDWNSIIAIFLRYTNNDFVDRTLTVDNLWIGPGRLDGLYQFRRSSTSDRGSDIIAASRGRLYRLDLTQKRFVELASGLVAYEPVSFATLNDVCYVGKKSDTPRMIISVSGNLVVYTAGIEAPGAAPVFSILAGGGALPAGAHDYRIVYFSTKTGKESNSVLGTTAATASGDAIRMASLPVSPDPKVDYLRIYRRDITDQTWRRVSASIYGEVTNGTLAYEDGTANADLGDELEGHPDYLIHSVPPKMAFLAAVGGRLIGAGNPDAEGTVYHSQENTGEQWDLGRGIVRLDLADNDIVTAVANAWGFAFIGKERGYWVGAPAQGTRTGFLYQQKEGGRESGHGPISHRGVVVMADSIYLRGLDRYYRVGRDWIARSVSEGWHGKAPIPGLLEPAMEDYSHENAKGYCCGAYNDRRAQIIWLEQRLSSLLPDHAPVYHIGHMRGLTEAGQDAGWAFHRYASGDSIQGLSCVATYVDDYGNQRVMGGGPGGFVYELDTDETADVLVTGRVKIASDIAYVLGFHGVALGHQHLKDFVYHDLAFDPLGNWNVNLEYFYDWGSQPEKSTTENPIDPADISVVSDLNAPTAFYAKLGGYTRVELPARRSRNIIFRAYSPAIDQPFALKEHTLFLEWMGSGVI